MSGSTIGGFAGGAIGFFVGGPQGAQWGFMIGSTIGGYVDPVQVEGPRLTDAQAQLSNEGVPRPIIYGTACVAGNIIQVGPLVEHKKTQRAGKGGPEQTTYTYTRDVAIRICEAAPLGGSMKLLRVWKNDKLVADFTEANTIPADTAAFASILTFYSGDEDQLPDPSLEALPEENGGGVGNVPAYRGTCYAVLTGLDVTETGGAVPQFRWEVCSEATETAEVCYPADWIVVGARTSGVSSFAISTDAQSFVASDFSGATSFVEWHGADIVIAGGTSAKYSGDNGASFQSCTGINTSGATIGDIAYADGVWFIASSSNKVWRSTDGQSYSPVTVGSGGTFDYAMAAHPGKVMAIGTKSSYSQDGGVSWTQTGGFVSWPTPRDMATDGVKFVAVTATGTDNIFKCTSGNTWVAVTSPFSGEIQAIAYDPIDSRWGIFSGRSFAYSASGEEDWTVVPNVLPSGERAHVQGLAAYGGKWVVGLNGGGIYSSLDGGTTWASRSSQPAYSARAVAHNGEPVQGIEIPDAPGLYVGDDGIVRSNCTSRSVTPGSVPLSEIVADLCARAGIAEDQIDVSALAGITVRGFPVARQTSAAEAIRALQQVFLFDFPEWGDGGEVQTKLRAVLRGGSPVLALTDDDLVDTDEDDETRGQQVEFPRKLSVTASDPEANYEPVTEAAERESENIKAVGEQQVSTAVVLTRDEIKQLADKLLKVLWEQATGRKKVEVPEEFSIYTPSDRLTYGGKTYRIDRVELLDGSSKWDLTRDRAGAYTSSATGGTPLTPTAPVSSIRGPTMFAAMNLPRLRSQDTTPGMYVAVCGLLPGWAGCDLYLSTDDGVTEQLVATILDASTMGVLTADLSASGSPLSVRLYDGELDSATVDQLLARHNAAAVTTDEVSEILQFQTATETAEDEYDLTDLSRGVLGTTADDHVAGDSFVALDAVTFLPLDIALAGKTLIFRPVSRGTAPANNATYSVQFKPQFTGPQVVEAYTDDAGNVYTDDDGNTYYYEVPST